MYISIMGDGNLSPHLTKREVRVASHVSFKATHQDLPFLFESVRKYAGGTSAKVHSAGRVHTPDGGVDDSAHKDGDAYDIHLSPAQMSNLKSNLIPFLLETRGKLGGFGVYPWGVHVDTQFDKAVNHWVAPGDVGGYLMRHWGGSKKKPYPKWLELDNQAPIIYESTDNDAEKDEGDTDEKNQISRFPSFTTFFFLIVGAFFIYKNS